MNLTTVIDEPAPIQPAVLQNAADHTRILGQIALSTDAVIEALRTIDAMEHNAAYSRYNLTVDPRKAGDWVQIILANWNGDASSGESVEYDGSIRWTHEGAKVPYIRRLVQETFASAPLKSVRIFSAQNAVIAAHRDYMEFKRGFRRLHIPLRTNEASVNSEGSRVYHMSSGYIYFLDGRMAHSGGNLSAVEPRIHLVLDFDPDVPIEAIFRNPDDNLTGGEIEWITRPKLDISDFEMLLDGMSKIISNETYPSIFLAANMLPFAYDFDAGKVYDVLVEAARRAQKPLLLERAIADRAFFVGHALATHV